ncbi:TlpA family protein disulfide reductase [Singulisphaera sp. PoT]|uniref:TlpA family protein disulfide reductase n=1 Tax=Singulisphaera sp. PoT TaxID=3411797 RepID=UPI003BF5DD16
MIRNPLIWLLGASLGVSIVANPRAFAADAPAVSQDPKAVELLGEVSKAYRSLSSYADKGEFVSSYKVNGTPVKQVQPAALAIVRPNKWKVEAGEVSSLCDGKTVTSAVAPFKKYSVEPASAKLSIETFRDGALGSLLFGGPHGATSRILFTLMTDEFAVKELTKGDVTLKLSEDQALEGITCHTLLLDEPMGTDFRLLIDPKTNFLRSIDWIVDKDLSSKAPANQKLEVERIGWSSGPISTEATKDDAFAFVAPVGYAKVEQGERKAPVAPKSPILELVGKPAPEFTLSVLDGPGKTRTVAKADLAGKVVLIDFWATWCPPCLEELPEIQKLTESLAEGKKNAIVVALSVDHKPRDLEEVRKLIEKTLGEHKVDFKGAASGLLALDPSGTIGEAFQVEAIPSLVILDTKGVVQSAYVGVQQRETLAKDIDTLLEGKSLIAPKADQPAEK